MSREVIVSDEARIDTIDIAYAIAEDNLSASDRFVSAVGAAFQQLADIPGMGVVRDYQNPSLRGARMWPVPGFRNYLIFYTATEDKLRILRVIHGARDLPTLFAPDNDASP